MTTPSFENAAVIGAGAMGTLCAMLLAERGVQVKLWGRDAAFMADLATHRENRRYLPGHELHDNIRLSSDFSDTLSAADVAISAMPTQFMRESWQSINQHCDVRLSVVSVAKGIEVGTLLRPTQILQDVLGNEIPVMALSGPCIASEVAAGLPTAAVIACTDKSVAKQMQATLSSPLFRVYTNDDVVGVELGGAVKNVISIAAGIGDGMDMGCNAKAGLVTRGIVEITRLGVAVGARADTFAGLAGVGDLMTTCMSLKSRNHAAGVKIGQGMAIADVIATSHGVIEGIESTRSVLALAEQYKVEMPITRAIFRVLFENQSPQSAIRDLMTRQLKAE